MTTLHATNALNIQESLNAWFRDALAATTKPASLPSYNIVFNMPETALQPPVFSVFHHDVDMQDLWQGRHVGETTGGMKKYGMMDVSAWVSRGNIHFMAQLATMTAMVEHITVNKPFVQVQDYSTPSSPSNVAYLIRIYEVEGASVEKDPNPDIERKRWLIKWCVVTRG